METGPEKKCLLCHRVQPLHAFPLVGKPENRRPNTYCSDCETARRKRRLTDRVQTLPPEPLAVVTLSATAEGLRAAASFADFLASQDILSEVRLTVHAPDLNRDAMTKLLNEWKSQQP